MLFGDYCQGLILLLLNICPDQEQDAVVMSRLFSEYNPAAERFDQQILAGLPLIDKF